jgi:radical SAM PhpK family P-methyltransferase
MTYDAGKPIKASKDRLDCVIIGHNDVDFELVQADLKKTREYSGAYNDLMSNSLNFRGQRTTYMNLLNAALETATGQKHNLHVCELPHLGSAYLKSFLKRRGFDAEIVNSFTYGKQRLRELLSTTPYSVAITTTFYVDNTPITEIVEFIKQHSPDTKVIVGGPHIYNLSTTEEAKTLDFIFQSMGADIYIHDSQGELTLSQVLGELRKGSGAELSKVPNLSYTSNGQTFQRTPRNIENNDMNENAVNWELFGPNFYTPTVQTRTARSCAFSCSFCKYPAMAGPLNLTSLEILERELNFFDEAGVKNVVFIDDTFNVPLTRFKEICRMMIKNKYRFDWYSFFRCANTDDQVFDLMAESGCRGVFLGIESGDQGILKDMNKFAVLDRYKHGMRMLRERNITTFASIIVGFPGETEESVKNTMRFLEENSPTFYRAELYYHYTNVPIHQRAKEFGIRGAGYSWKHHSMDWKTASALAHEIYKTVKGPVVLPGYMFDFWSIPYLLGRGLTLDQIIGFAKIAQEMMIGSLDDSFPDTSDMERRLTSILSPDPA